MRPRYGTGCLLAVLALVLLPAFAAHAQSEEQAGAFVQVRNGRFLFGGHPYYFAGTNLWYDMNLGAGLQEGDRERLLRELDELERLGLSNLRVLAASEGPAREPWRVHPAVKNAPGEYDERLLRGLDLLLAEMAERDMKAVFVLNNFFQWSGGMAQYYAWASGTEIPYPMQDGNTWDEFQHYAAQFYESSKSRQLFVDYVDTLIHRKNHLTGQLYRDDPTIMAWQLANEPRGLKRTEAYVDWVEEAAGFIQQNDPKPDLSRWRGQNRAGQRDGLRAGQPPAGVGLHNRAHLDRELGLVWEESAGRAGSLLTAGAALYRRPPHERHCAVRCASRPGSARRTY